MFIITPAFSFPCSVVKPSLASLDLGPAGLQAGPGLKEVKVELGYGGGVDWKDAKASSFTIVDFGNDWFVYEYFASYIKYLLCGNS